MLLGRLFDYAQRPYCIIANVAFYLQSHVIFNSLSIIYMDIDHMGLQIHFYVIVSLFLPRSLSCSSFNQPIFRFLHSWNQTTFSSFMRTLLLSSPLQWTLLRSLAPVWVFANIGNEWWNKQKIAATTEEEWTTDQFQSSSNSNCVIKKMYEFLHQIEISNAHILNVCFSFVLCTVCCVWHWEQWKQIYSLRAVRAREKKRGRNVCRCGCWQFLPLWAWWAKRRVRDLILSTWHEIWDNSKCIRTI